MLQQQPPKIWEKAGDDVPPRKATSFDCPITRDAIRPWMRLYILRLAQAELPKGNDIPRDVVTTMLHEDGLTSIEAKWVAKVIDLDGNGILGIQELKHVVDLILEDGAYSESH